MIKKGLSPSVASCVFFSSRRRHTRLQGDWSSDVCSSDLFAAAQGRYAAAELQIIKADFAEKLQALANFRQNVARDFGFVAGEFQTRQKFEGKIGRASCRERV